MSTNTAVKTVTKEQLTVKTQVLATLFAVTGAVALPQIFHALGAVSGFGTALGETFLPMHLPIILVGLLAGPYAGIAAGLLGPLCSFALSGMPAVGMLPFIMIELAVYGLSAGLFQNIKLPTLGKVVTVQLAGRVIRAAAILIAVYGLHSTSVQTAVIWNSILKGLPGLVLQWGLLPLIMFWTDNKKKHER